MVKFSIASLYLKKYILWNVIYSIIENSVKVHTLKSFYSERPRTEHKAFTGERCSLKVSQYFQIEFLGNEMSHYRVQDIELRWVTLYWLTFYNKHWISNESKVDSKALRNLVSTHLWSLLCSLIHLCKAFEPKFNADIRPWEPWISKIVLELRTTSIMPY